MLTPNDRTSGEHHVVVLVSPEVVTAWLTKSAGGAFTALRVDDGLPQGARFVRAFVEPDAGSFALVFEHDSFAPVEHGSLIPQARVMFRTAHGICATCGADCKACRP